MIQQVALYGKGGSFPGKLLTEIQKHTCKALENLGMHTEVSPATHQCVEQLVIIENV